MDKKAKTETKKQLVTAQCTKCDQKLSKGRYLYTPTKECLLECPTFYQRNSDSYKCEKFTGSLLVNRDFRTVGKAPKTRRIVSYKDDLPILFKSNIRQENE